MREVVVAVLMVIGGVFCCIAGLGILRPFIHMSKGGIAAMGQDLGVDFSRTYSCYKGGAVHCGVCSTCMERREAFREAGIPDPTAYAPAE